jgi:hypothetical protein
MIGWLEVVIQVTIKDFERRKTKTRVIEDTDNL